MRHFAAERFANMILHPINWFNGALDLWFDDMAVWSS
jgi:hypothetical protein